MKLSYKCQEQVRDHIGALLCYLVFCGNELLLKSMVVKGVIKALKDMRKVSFASAASEAGPGEPTGGRGMRTASVLEPSSCDSFYPGDRLL